MLTCPQPINILINIYDEGELLKKNQLFPKWKQFKKKEIETAKENILDKIVYLVIKIGGKYGIKKKL